MPCHASSLSDDKSSACLPACLVAHVSMKQVSSNHVEASSLPHRVCPPGICVHLSRQAWKLPAQNVHVFDLSNPNHRASARALSSWRPSPTSPSACGHARGLRGLVLRGCTMRWTWPSTPRCVLFPVGFRGVYAVTGKGWRGMFCFDQGCWTWPSIPLSSLWCFVRGPGFRCCVVLRLGTAQH